ICAGVFVAVKRLAGPPNVLLDAPDLFCLIDATAKVGAAGLGRGAPAPTARREAFLDTSTPTRHPWLGGGVLGRALVLCRLRRRRPHHPSRRPRRRHDCRARRRPRRLLLRPRRGRRQGSWSGGAGGRLRFLAVRRRVSGPEMTAAFWADPELIGFPVVDRH